MGIGRKIKMDELTKFAGQYGETISVPNFYDLTKALPQMISSTCRKFVSLSNLIVGRVPSKVAHVLSPVPISTQHTGCMYFTSRTRPDSAFCSSFPCF